ncbi:NFACT RNA binding domain-containing protein [Peptoniphilus sp. KCTC 25270]|uniref:Rqc2 family fibronectin-binding protein n=1 Tax=Peptoniphilus sp. KCTC 25270 TaxID=2897414 RepID=UPI001E54C168|nr:NFACT RNA binding domain-containing protein [Peptoniphilus sp. KCTC 25270]MCD1147122.1 NFACT RNA binding domain-containing protein [Peptoniphilus sp. KCTC 25270]
MSFDGTVTKALIYELNEQFTGGKVDRIFQTEKDELLLQLRSGKNRGNLILSASANNPRAYITQEKKKNPSTPPAFCMLLRKHLESATILGFEQIEMDRMIHIHLEGTNELFDRVQKILAIEIMGRHSNIILIDKESHTVIDSIKRVNSMVSRVRQVLPGLPYSYEEILSKENPLKETPERFREKFENSSDVSVKNFLLQNYMGFSPLIAREISYRATIEDALPLSHMKEELPKLEEAFFSTMKILKENRYEPNGIFEGDRVVAFSCLPLTQYPDSSRKSYDSISEMLDNIFTSKDLGDRIRQKSQNLHKMIKNQLDRALKKQEKMELELRDAKEREKYKIYGDVLSANSWAVERGDQEVTLENFYDNMNPVTIPLDIKKDAVQNAAHYYKKYSKLKHAESTIQEQLKHTRGDIRYLDELLFTLEEAESVEDIDLIKEEFREEFLKKSPSSQKKKKKEKQRDFLSFETETGEKIYVGRNNRENGELTLKFARKDDLWFHVKSGPGSHVILRSPEEPTKEAIEMAASLAAYYSRQKLSANVEIDYTERKYIKRHPLNQPGLVIYTDFQTIFVTPDKKIFSKLKKYEKATGTILP